MCCFLVSLAATPFVYDAPMQIDDENEQKEAMHAMLSSSNILDSNTSTSAFVGDNGLLPMKLVIDDSLARVSLEMQDLVYLMDTRF